MPVPLPREGSRRKAAPPMSVSSPSTSAGWSTALSSMRSAAGSCSCSSTTRRRVSSAPPVRALRASSSASELSVRTSPSASVDWSAATPLVGGSAKSARAAAATAEKDSSSCGRASSLVVDSCESLRCCVGRRGADATELAAESGPQVSSASRGGVEGGESGKVCAKGGGRLIAVLRGEKGGRKSAVEQSDSALAEHVVRRRAREDTPEARGRRRRGVGDADRRSPWEEQGGSSGRKADRQGELRLRLLRLRLRYRCGARCLQVCRDREVSIEREKRSAGGRTSGLSAAVHVPHALLKLLYHERADLVPHCLNRSGVQGRGEGVGEVQVDARLGVGRLRRGGRGERPQGREVAEHAGVLCCGL